jgi:hypothetical protein
LGNSQHFAGYFDYPFACTDQSNAGETRASRDKTAGAQQGAGNADGKTQTNT